MKPVTKLLLLSLAVSPLAMGAHPQLLTTADQHDAIVKKVKSVDWAQSAFSKLQQRIDHYVAQTQNDPEWMVSRLAMNWETHYITPITKGSRTIDGKGKAEVPTPRFAGARDWKTDYVRQTPIDQLKPFNDKDGKIMLVNEKTGKEEWVHPSITGHAIERINNEVMALAADAAFLYWVTGDETYAQFAAPILWTYMNGLAHSEKPVILDEDGGPSRIIGTSSYEVIHDGILHSIAVAYDYLYDYIAADDAIDGAVIEKGIKRFVDRIIEGGGSRGNWNLHQAKKIAYGGMVLGPNATYEDGKGREYYVDVALNADIPSQWGVTHVIREGYDQKTAVWAEAPGYAFDTTANIIEIVSLLSSDPAGREALRNPILKKAVLGQLKQTYPAGFSHAMGDTSFTRVDTRALELMLCWALDEGDTESARVYSAALQAEVASGKYDRNAQESLLALTRYAAELPEGHPDALKKTPTYFAEPINLVMQESMPSNGDVRYALGAIMNGTKGGHMHANGLAIELYGAGHVLAFDSGRGSSYWQADHGEYYSKAPAHNTVIVNGTSSYASHGKGTIAMTIEAVEPAFDAPATNPHLSYVTAGFKHVKPAATQQRTLALVRVDDTTAFYFDVFRSKLDDEGAAQYHDWIYHAMADSLDLKKTRLKASSDLTSENGNQKGYDYFSKEQSAKTKSVIHAHGPLQVEEDHVAMDVWVLDGQKRGWLSKLFGRGVKRTVYRVEAPANRGARHYIPEACWDQRRPALVVRQEGEAWTQPFVAVYEPSLQADGSKIKSVKALGENRWKVSGDDWSATLTLDGVKLSLNLK
jgi:outer membrane protein assembly factor BamB